MIYFSQFYYVNFGISLLLLIYVIYLYRADLISTQDYYGYCLLLFISVIFFTGLIKIILMYT